ncbi:MAG: hypothetical protein L6Q72_09915 [Burkholderiaceae bacterium]|nr:hypothetical protein [Burkholderiaceae bacterium]
MTAADPTRLARASGWLLVGVWLAELGSVVTSGRVLSGLALVGLVTYVALAWMRASRHIRVLFVCVTGLAFAIAWFAGDWRILLRGFERVQIFGAFFPAVLLLRATAESSPQVNRLQTSVERLSAAQARAWTLYGSHALGAILNVGAMAILAPAVTRDAGDARRAILASGAAHGVGTAVMWSPFFVSLAFVSQLVPTAPLWQAMLIGAGLAVMGLALSHALYTPGLRGTAFAESVRLLGGLMVPTAIMVSAVVAATLLFGLSGLQAVAVVVPIVCTGCLVLQEHATRLEVARRTLISFTRLSDELLIVVGSMVLGVAVGSLPLVGDLAASVTPGVIAGWPLLAAMVALLVGLGQLGLHPMVGASVLVPLISAGAFEISPSVLVAAAVFAWGLSAAVSIWTLPVAVAATTFAVPLSQLWTRRSVAFGVVLGAIGVVYLGVVNAWLTGQGE